MKPKLIIIAGPRLLFRTTNGLLEKNYGGINPWALEILATVSLSPSDL